MAPKILVVLTSHSELGNTGKKTGWYLPEFAHPYDVFKAAGAELTVASPAGGLAPLDPNSVEASKEDASSVSFLNTQKSLWEKTTKLDAIADKAADEYDALFFPGGHGPMFDLANDPTSQRVAAAFAAKGKPVAAVCHGPAALVGVKDPRTGEYLLKGKTVTGFSNDEEEAVGLTKAMPFLLESRLNEVSGGKYVKADKPWEAKVVVDGNVITGQNPASAKGVGEAIVKALS
ncbi:hypothetical protein VTK73DRAFT_1703 [Phialemonium thermophilum]|uniref:D-lactate dehydratase n=1 Tax=Phialemonium thermophilum TaxID=223376 RepID=A0ABR3X7W4_9PEZI